MHTLLMGFGLDDLNAIRFTIGQSVAARIRVDPSFSLEPRFGPRPEPGPYPYVTFGLGVWGLVELDSLAQIVRLGDAGIFLGGSTGMFGSFVFSAIDVTLAYRPLSVTAFYLDGEGDATGVQFGNPIIELSLTYTLPW